MVDGVLTSCYADVHHDLAHLTIITMQKFAKVMEWIIGTDFEFLVYVDTVTHVAGIILPNGQFWSY